MPLLKLENHAKVKSKFFSKALNYLSNIQCLKLYIILTSYSKLHVAAAAKSLQSCLTVQPHRWQPTRLLCPQDSPGKNTGVGCHFLLHLNIETGLIKFYLANVMLVMQQL